MSELKPCPFCGSDDCTIGRGDFDSGVIFFECKRCGVYVEPEGCYDDEAKAVELWNTRAGWALDGVWVKEKTCRNVHEPPKTSTFWPAPHFKCSRCGAVHVSTDYVFYCPFCGAKVVEG